MAMDGREDAELLAAIGRALGLPGPFQEACERDGYLVEVLAGAVDADRDRVGWVERHTFPPPDADTDEWVNVWLRIAGDGVQQVPPVQGWVYFDEPGRRISVSLTDSRADHISGVPHLRFLDDTVLVVADKGGSTELCRLTLDGAGLHGVQVQRLSLGGPAAVSDYGEDRDDIALCHLSAPINDAELLMYSLTLPDLAPRVPIPVPEPGDPAATVTELHADPAGACWAARALGDPDEAPARRQVTLRLPSARQRGLLADPEELWSRLRAALDGPDTPPDGPDILIGTVARPFWDVLTFDAARRPAGVARGPWWFPAAWHHYLASPVGDGGAGRPDRAAGWLRWLDRLAATAGDPAGQRGWAPEWSREEGIERFALTHLYRQAGRLAAACRAGTLPITGDWAAELCGPLPVTGYPPGFARAWRRLPDRFRPGGSAV